MTITKRQWIWGVVSLIMIGFLPAAFGAGSETLVISIFLGVILSAVLMFIIGVKSDRLRKALTSAYIPGLVIAALFNLGLVFMNSTVASISSEELVSQAKTQLAFFSAGVSAGLFIAIFIISWKIQSRNKSQGEREITTPSSSDKI